MTRDELIREFRILTRDRVEPYLWERDWVASWLDEAQIEACIRGRLLHESADPAVCEIDVTAGEAVYPLHAALYELDHLGFKVSGDTLRRKVRLVSTEELDDLLSDWRDRTGRVEYAVQDDTRIRLVPTPDEAGTLLLEGYRLPLTSLATSGAASPEIHQSHHRHLLQWALYRAYSIPDAESLDLDRAALAERAFADYFGTRPDSDLRRITRVDVEHRNKAWP